MIACASSAIAAGERSAGRDGCRAGIAAEIARDRRGISRVVVLQQQLAHHRLRSRRPSPAPASPAPRPCRAARSVPRAARKTAPGPARRSRSPPAAGRTRSSSASSSRRQGLARIRSISASGTATLPTFLLSLSTNTGRAGSKRRSWSHTSVSKRFCVGCGWPGNHAQHRAAVAGQRLQVQHLRARRGPAHAAAASCPSPVGPQTTRKSSRPASAGQCRPARHCGRPCSRPR